jgi:FtsZ-binding cell division protein ZapB
MDKDNIEVPKPFLSKLKEAFAFLTAPAVVTQKFGSAVLEDGTQIQWDGDQPMPGQPIMAVTPDGNTAPVPDGTYIIPADGSTIVVEGGLIASVVPANAAPDANAPANPMDNGAANAGMSDTNTQSTPKEITKRIEEVHKFAEDEIGALKENLKTLSEAFAAVKQESEDLKKENGELKEKFAAFSATAIKAIEEIGNAPQVVEPTPVVFRNEDANPTETDEERRQRIFGSRYKPKTK